LKFQIAKAPRWAVVGARVLRSQVDFADGPTDRDGFVKVDLLINQGRLAAVAPTGALDVGETPRLALAGRIVLPLFLDAHTHLDKGHIWGRSPNPTGDFMGAVTTVMADREARWSGPDVAQRMEFNLQAAYAHGTRAIRTHIDSLGAQPRISFPVFAEARERWRGRIDLQASPLFMIDAVFEPGHLETIEEVVDAHGSKLIGAVATVQPCLREGLEILFTLAERKGWDLDFHLDETADPEARALRVVAETAIQRKFPGRILVGHCCSLTRQDNDERQRTLDLVARAGLSVVSLPMCNMFLQDREAGRTPRWRGVTAIQELKAAGANVMIASDNTRDPFYAYGDLDMLEVWREGVRILHLDYPFADWAHTVFDSPATAMGLRVAGFRSGESADFILTEAREFTELFSRPHSERLVVREGRAITATPPAYTELDTLEGLAS
jgi:cytosine/creatinine deaminase